MSLAANALTTIATMEGELGIAVGSDDSFLTRLINAASDRIEAYCGRSFYHVAAAVESLAGFGGFYLRVRRSPLLLIDSITYDGATVASAGYEIDTPGAGMIRSAAGFNWTAGYVRSITDTPLPGTESKLYEVTYEGGWYTPDQSRARGALTFTGQPGAEETMTIHNTVVRAKTSGAGADEFNIGGSVQDTCDNLVAAILAGSEAARARAERVGLTVVFEWLEDGTAGNSIVFTEAFSNCTIVDGDGTLGDVQAGAVRTLPYAIEDACIQLATKRYRRKGKDPGIKSSRLLSSATTFAGTSTGDSIMGLPTEIAQMLSPYKVLAQA